MQVAYLWEQTVFVTNDNHVCEPRTTMFVIQGQLRL